ncbi:helix-turn-helix domain-containing protein [Thiorhodococcus minor]|uniref:Helix-turn-helix domain-containing protein n=1 Tax=Thiorhodococcus minor TaxID=57489 RepID=A0A6M0JV17_9GAMM|nr:hypothetical protein [Thiorhodococcus minor]
MTVAEDGDGPPEVRSVSPLPGLPDRDRCILERYQAGASKRGIARELGISDGTVRNVLNRLAVE